MKVIVVKRNKEYLLKITQGVQSFLLKLPFDNKKSSYLWYAKMIRVALDNFKKETSSTTV